ncbi:membrane-spanning 4-domains subfamily A member 4A-like [Neoarius graeffei]|uniref:membrane-spanning 4-domains subfamily A member 4A-like n=1 Tax=Neoarius graeffei TaxID=443677 RepID=UPI00298C26C6|nr:membrane-spanning 4-domains subfamily A member 4A-like [Neoarius graeffei]XP_060774622.1 membrane-spanning 4-domains subfamily A member 4A-like [Neoarius graeffei]XP_060774623.1 membrane-spanning 4-domains subfamily A member 4A-like [Neoarius graeffei]
MASASIPLTNVGSGYTIVTDVLPSSTAPTTAGQNPCQTISPLQKFLKGEPKALGTVQIMVGVLMILFGIVLAISPPSISVFSGVVFWVGSLLHISAGSLAVAANNKLNHCVVKATMVVNILSTIAAGIAIIILSITLVILSMFRSCYYGEDDCRNWYLAMSYSHGITGVLLVFSVLQFAVSIAVSAFTCKAVCSSEPTLSIVNVVQNPEMYVPVVNSYPAQQPQPGVSTMNAVAMSSAPMESPPAYCEKGHPDD